MNILFLVLNNINYLNNILKTLKDAGITGGTIIDSKGMFHTLKDNNDPSILESFKMFLEDPRPDSKTIFFIVNDSDMEKAKKIIDTCVGGIDTPNTGIMFSLKLDFVAGLKKN